MGITFEMVQHFDSLFLLHIHCKLLQQFGLSLVSWGFKRMSFIRIYTNCNSASEQFCCSALQVNVDKCYISAPQS